MSARVLRCSVMRCVYNTPLKHNRACQEALVFVQTVIKMFALSLSPSLSLSLLFHSFFYPNSVTCLSLSPAHSSVSLSGGKSHVHWELWGQGTPLAAV